MGGFEMKILMISSYYPTIGGAEKYLYEISSILSKKNSIFVLAPNIYGDIPRSEFKVFRAWTLIKNNKLIKKFFPLEYVQNYSFIIPAVLKGRKIIKKEKIDIIHVHYGLAYGIIGLILKKITKKPLIITLHGGGLDIKGFKKIFNLAIKKVLKGSDKVITVSDAIRKKANRIYERDIEVIHNGIHINDFKNKGDNNFVLGVGILSKRKGFEYLIKTAARKELKEVNFKIVGDGPEREHLERLIKDLNLKNVELLGSLSHEKVKEILSECSALVLPSNYDAFGLVLIEAMACSKPVIGTKVGGIPEVIKDKENGFLIKPGNVNELFLAIKKLMSEKKLRKKMGNKGKERVKKMFTWDITIKKMNKMYKELIRK